MPEEANSAVTLTAPTEMQKKVGETHTDGCGTLETVDFLFGFTGYDYEVVTDADFYTKR